MAAKTTGIGNLAVWYGLAAMGYTTNDGWDASNLNPSGIAQVIIGPATRVVTSIASGKLMLKSIASGEAVEPMFVINDSPNTILVFPFTGEFQNGVANASLSIATGKSAVFFPVTNNLAQQWLPGATEFSDWRSAVIP
jgi:hypothetical protein